MWGKSGPWPVAEAVRFEFGDMAAYAAFRRLMRSFAKAQAAKELREAVSAVAQAKGQPEGEKVRADASFPLSKQTCPAKSPLKAERAQSGSAVGQPPRAVCRMLGAGRSLSYTRRMLKCPDAKISGFRGMSRWASSQTVQAMVRNLWDRGFDVVECVTPVQG